MSQAHPVRTRRRVLGTVVGAAVVLLALQAATRSPAAFAEPPPVPLGAATPFAVLAGTTVTNTGITVVSGDLGVHPGTAVTGFPPGRVINGVIHAADAVALQAKNDLVTAYDNAAGRTPATALPVDIGGRTLVAGIYRGAAAVRLTGTVTLNAQGDPNAVFIVQAGSTLITAPGSRVALINGAQPCNVFWQVGSSATLGTNTTFVGSVLALTSITVQTRTTVAGRVLARNGAVTLDSNRITQSACALAPSPTASPTVSPTTVSPSPTVPVPPTTTPTFRPAPPVPVPTGSPTTTPTGTPNPTATPTPTPTPTPTRDDGPGAPDGVGGPGAGDTGDGGGVGGPPGAPGGTPAPTGVSGGVGGPNDVIPEGAPETGVGGTAPGPGIHPLVGVGGLLVAGSMVAMTRAVRRDPVPTARRRPRRG